MTESLYQQLRQVSRQGTNFNNGWHALDDLSLINVPSEWQQWLIHEGSLTSKLIEFSGGNFRVRVLSEHWARPTRYAASKLHLQQHLAVRVREVELLCNNAVVVFARTIIPLGLHRRNQALFGGMGSRPLGHFLFREGQIKIAKRDIRVHHSSDGDIIYSRATPYKFRNSEILVCEHFVNPLLANL